MDNYKVYTILFIAVNLFLVAVAVVYIVFFKSDPIYNILDTLGELW